MAPLVAPRQFDVFENPSDRTRGYAPYVVVQQSHHLAALLTAIVAPVIRDADRRLSLLDLPVEVEDESLTLALAEMATPPVQLLKTRIGTVAHDEDAIRRGLDRLFTGF